MEKNFINGFEAWYSESSKIVNPYPHLYIQIINDDGNFGEFMLEWNRVGIQLHAFDDSWDALYQANDLLEYMNEISLAEKSVTINEFSNHLLELGYSDITERIRPDDYMKDILVFNVE